VARAAPNCGHRGTSNCHWNTSSIAAAWARRGDCCWSSSSKESTISTFDGVEEDDGPKDLVRRRRDLEEDPSDGVENNLEEPDLPILLVQERIGLDSTVARRGAKMR
jgi:hypothetical protein